VGERSLHTRRLHSAASTEMGRTGGRSQRSGGPSPTARFESDRGRSGRLPATLPAPRRGARGQRRRRIEAPGRAAGARRRRPRRPPRAAGVDDFRSRRRRRRPPVRAAFAHIPSAGPRRRCRRLARHLKTPHGGDERQGRLLHGRCRSASEMTEPASSTAQAVPDIERGQRPRYPEGASSIHRPAGRFFSPRRSLFFS
jgi:hypothetical protein